MSTKEQLASQAWNLGLSSLTCVSSAVVGGYGLWYFTQSEFATGTEPTNEDGICTSAGYDQADFVGLFFGTYFLPIAVIAALVFMVGVYRWNKLSTTLRLGIFTILMAFFIFCAAESYQRWGREIMDCGIIGCPWGSTDNGNSDYYGFIPISGVLLFIVSLMMILADMTLIFFTLIPSATAEEGERLLEARRLGFPEIDVDKYTTERETERKRNICALVSVFLVFYPLVWFCCLLLPNQWTYFTAYYLAEEAVTDVSAAELSTSDVFQSHTWNFFGAYLKVYPDVTMFYMFIYACAIVGLMTQVWPAFNRAMQHRMKVPYFESSYISVSVLVFSALFATLITLFTYYCIQDKDWAWEYGDTSNAENWARTFGMMGNLLMGLLILPVARNSIWPAVFGVSWERMLDVHIVLSYTYLGVVATHMFCWWKVYAEKDFFPHDILAVPMYYPDNDLGSDTPCADDFTVPLAMITFMCMLVVFLIFTYSSVRRGNFELFYYSHHIFLVVFLVQLWHASSSWYYIIGGLSLWAADRGIRFWNGARGLVNQAELQSHKQVTEIFIPGCSTIYDAEIRSRFRYQAGQYAFVNIPMISPLEWHPLSISSAPCDSYTTFHVRSMGEGTWTDKLNKLAKQWESEGVPDDFSVVVDAPYGTPIDSSQYDKIVLVAGGIGITPCVSMYRQLYAEAQALISGVDVHLIWIVKDKDELNMFRSTFDAINRDDMGGRFKHSLFVTQGGPNASNRGRNSNKSIGSRRRDRELGDWKGSDDDEKEHYSSHSEHDDEDPIEFEWGRPNLEVVLEDTISEIEYNVRSRVVVHCCGPQGLMDACSDLAHQIGAGYSHETFEL